MLGVLAGIAGYSWGGYVIAPVPQPLAGIATFVKNIIAAADSRYIYEYHIVQQKLII